jgi:hypothetical protein
MTKDGPVCVENPRKSANTFGTSDREMLCHWGRMQLKTSIIIELQCILRPIQTL